MHDCNVVRDVQIYTDSHPKFHEHSATVTKKANQLLSIIHIVFHYLTKLHLSTYTNRPVLEYGNDIWGPLFVLNQQKVQSHWCMIFMTILIKIIL